MRPKRTVQKLVDTPTEQAKAILYARVSSEQQKRSGLGIAEQLAKLEAWAKERGIADYVVFTDEAESGRSTDRPKLNEALELLASGERNLLVGTKMDRLGRSVKDILWLKDTSEEQGWNIAVCDGSVAFDSRTPQGKFALLVIAAVAEMESDMISQRTRDALIAARERGTGGTISAEIERRIIDLVDQHGLLGTAKILNDEGVKTARGGTWYATTVRNVVLRFEDGGKRSKHKRKK